MVEWYWQGETEVLVGKHYIVWVIGEWLCMEQWWNGTDRGKLMYWGETLYSLGGMWMNGYGAIEEWSWQAETEVLGEKHYIVCVVVKWMGMEQWWNGTDTGKRKYLEEKNI